MIILHGENITASRNRLNEIIKKAVNEVVFWDGKNVSLANLRQTLEATTLFGTRKSAVIENLMAAPKSKRKVKILTYLKEKRPKNVVLWEKKKIDGRSLVSFKEAKIELYKLTPVIFKFLDGLSPNSKTQTLKLLHLTLEQNPPEMVLWMLAKQIRHLIIAHEVGQGSLPRAVPVWKRGSLISQSQQFNLEGLLACHRRLMEIEWAQKTGRAHLPLTAELDLLLARL